MDRIKKIFNRYESIFAAVVGIVPSFLLGLNSSTMDVPYWSLVLSITISLLILWLAILWKNSKTENITFTARIINFDINSKKLIFTVNIKNILTYGSIFIVYYKENEYEEKMAVAIVTNIQDNGLIQADIIHWIKEPETVITNEKIIIKPSCTEPFSI